MLPPSIIECILRKLKVIIDDSLTSVFSQPVNAPRTIPDTSRCEVSNERAPHMYVCEQQSCQLSLKIKFSILLAPEINFLVAAQT